MEIPDTNNEENMKENPPPCEKQDNSHANKDLGDPTSMAASGESNSDTLLPDDVLCDSCIENHSKAVKSCLTCLVSYCESHLRPHLENAKFQNHRLVDPLHDIECRTCEVHHLPLERFCLADGCCVCRDCESQEHDGHTSASVGEARKEIETELQKKQVEIIQSVSAAEKAVGKLQSNNASIKSSVAGVGVVIEEQFARLQTAVEEARRGAVEVLQGEQRQALKQAEGIQAHLEQRRAELTKTLAQMDRLSRNKTDVDFLREYSEWKKGVMDVCLPGVYVNLMDHLAPFSHVVTDATQELCDQILSSYREKLVTVCKSGTKAMVQAQMAESQPSPLPDPETREGFLKYTRSLTFDPDTTHHFLRLTEDSRKLTNTSPWQHSYPDNPGRFEYWRQAMTSESLYLGRHYIEIELSGEGAHIGVTYKSIDRKGEQNTSCITGNDFSWCLGRNRRGFSAWHAGVETPLEGTDITRIGLYVDFYQGSIAFYDVTGSITLLHKYKADFIEPLYATAWLSKKDNIVSLINANTMHNMPTPAAPDC
ncbi:tripartite motif-containing protein 16-like protein [Centroberyx affinis]|uniref:tripartite motif-containing protein 16-like protein n=1 Tax=Centroberyx affinis TaxID=166261 RepID=UPI003A5BA3E2